MRSFLFLLLVLGFGTKCWSQEAVLLTSLKISDKKKLRIERLFLKTIAGTQLKPVIKHSAGPEDLLIAIRSARTQSLLWVSHAGEGQETSRGIRSNDVILDVFGNDVKNFFAHPAKSLRFLGIIGCESGPIIEQLKKQGGFDANPGLEILNFNKRIELFAGLKVALRALEQVRPLTDLSQTVMDTSYEIQAHVRGTMPAGWLQMGTKILSYHVGKSNDEVSLSVPLRSGLRSRNIMYFRDKRLPPTEDEWDLSLISSKAESWSIFADDQGKPIGGHSQRLYIWKRTKPL